MNTLHFSFMDITIVLAGSLFKIIHNYIRLFLFRSRMFFLYPNYIIMHPMYHQYLAIQLINHPCVLANKHR
jgi:hypothetical protein